MLGDWGYYDWKKYIKDNKAIIAIGKSRESHAVFSSSVCRFIPLTLPLWICSWMLSWIR